MIIQERAHGWPILVPSLTSSLLSR